MANYEIIPSANHSEWLEQRKHGIGASEAAVVVGESPYKSILALWAEKTGQIEPDDLSENEKVFWGMRLESTIIDVYRDRTGRETRESGELLRSVEYPWAQCTLDAWTDVDGDQVPLEVKNVGLRMESNWDNGPDPLYNWQCQHQLLVTGCKKMSIAALVGGQRLIWCDVERDEIMIRRLIHAGVEFWGMVRSGTAPEPDGSDSAKTALYGLYPEDDGETIQLPGELEECDARRQELNEQIAAAMAEKRAIENRIKSALGTATRGILPSGDGYSWTAVNKAAYQVKASSNRVLRRHKAKQ